MHFQMCLGHQLCLRQADLYLQNQYLKSEGSPSLSLSSDTWYDLLSMKKTLSEAEEEGLVEMNESEEVRKFFSCFDLESLNS